MEKQQWSAGQMQMKNELTDVLNAHASGQWHVMCLCAAWCGVCRQYEADFQGLQHKFPNVRFEWIDVEESEAVMGDVDVETFPTLLIGAGEKPLFLGPLLPQIGVLERLLGSLLEGHASTSALPKEAHALYQRALAYRK